jgi:hypothetical protein
MPNRTYEERIADLQKKQKQLKEQERLLLSKQSKEERKKDARSKILLGSEVVAVLKRYGFDVSASELDPSKLSVFLDGQEKRGGYLSSAFGLVKKVSDHE